MCFVVGNKISQAKLLAKLKAVAYSERKNIYAAIALES